MTLSGFQYCWTHKTPQVSQRIGDYKPNLYWHLPNLPQGQCCPLKPEELALKARWKKSSIALLTVTSRVLSRCFCFSQNRYAFVIFAFLGNMNLCLICLSLFSFPKLWIFFLQLKTVFQSEKNRCVPKNLDLPLHELSHLAQADLWFGATFAQADICPSDASPRCWSTLAALL